MVSICNVGVDKHSATLRKHVPLPDQSPVLSGASERTKSPGCFSSRFRVDLNFLRGKDPHSRTRHTEGCKPVSYSRLQRLLRPQQGKVNHVAVPPGYHRHAVVIRPPCVISHPSETPRPPVPVISLRQRPCSPPSCKHLALLGFMDQMAEEAESSLAAAEDLRLDAVTQQPGPNQGNIRL